MARDTESYRTKISPFRKAVGFGILLVLFGISAALVSGRVEKFVVTSESMEPTILIGDYLLVDARRPVTPRRGDIVAIWDPSNPRERLCKRVVAVPFDEVRFEDGFFYLNNEPQIDEDYVAVERIEGLPDQKTIRLGSDEYYVLGDNRAYSFDSMNFGPVRAHTIIGVAKYIYWPRGRMRVIRNPHDESSGKK